MGLVQGRSQYNWDHGVPCRNPQCKSYGKPHPNCQCTSSGPQSGSYGGSGPAGPSKSVTELYAEGGNVGDHPCSGVHKTTCEYYAGDPELGKHILQKAIDRHISEDDVTNAMLGKSNPEQAMHCLAVSRGASGIMGKIRDSFLGDGEKNSGLNSIYNKRLKKNSGKLLNKISMSPNDVAMSPDFIKNDIRPEVKKIIGQNNTHVIDAVINAISKGEIDDLGSIIKHAKNVSGGHKSIQDSIESLFSGEKIDHATSDKDRENLKEFIKNGGINSQIMNENNAASNQPVEPMAAGGEINSSVPQSSIQKTFPEQSMLLGMTKGSLNNYLQQQQPSHDLSLPFDSHHKDERKEKQYNTALDIANNPLGVIKSVQNGTLTPEHLRHLSGMYPDLYDHLQKKSTGRLIKAQMNDERPPYRVRQSLSLFLGSPLDSTMTPQSIQSIQMTFSKNKQANAESAGPIKKGTAKMGKMSQSLETPDQARTAKLNQR